MLAKEMIRQNPQATDEDFRRALEEAKRICEEERKKVLEAGGLHIVGTERHEARRIDNQLRGRAGRQGDPGSSRFFLSLEDDLMRIFGGDRISSLMDRLKMDENVPIENRMVTRAIENAQKRVEAHNFEIRKHLLEYDDVMNQQRTEIYSFRRQILGSENLKDIVYQMLEDVVDELLEVHCPEDVHPEDWELDKLQESIFGLFGVKIEGLNEFTGPDALREHILNELKKFYEEKEAQAGEDVMRYIERVITLQVVDNQWKDHLLAMDHLREGIGLRGYGQKDPLVEYKKEAFEMFAEMSQRIKRESLMRLFRIEVRTEEETAQVLRHRPRRLIYNRSDGGEERTPVKKGRKIGRNEPCPCGSGKKYKKCCGANA